MMFKFLRSTLERVPTLGAPTWTATGHSTNIGISSKIGLTLQEDIELPKKPKKPLIPWLVFVRERRDAVMRQNELFKMVEVTSALAKEWKSIDKSKYEEEYNRQREEYLKQCEKYENSLTDQQREYINLKKEINRETKAKKLIQKLKPPKMPRNPANMYCAEKYKLPEVKDQIRYRKLSEITKDLFKEYRQLSDQEKSTFIDMARNDMFRFRDEFNQWYANVMANEELSKAVKDTVNNMRNRFETLKYI